MYCRYRWHRESGGSGIVDIDSKAILGGKLRFVAFCAYVAATVYVFFEVHFIFGLLMLPLAARFASFYIVHTVIDETPYQLRKWRYDGWHGNYYEFDGRQLRIDDFDKSMETMPLIAVEDLENLFDDRARFRIKGSITPAAGPLEGIPSIPADRAAGWARVIAGTSNAQAGRAGKLALLIERSFVEPREKDKHLDTVKAFEARK